MTFTKKLTLFLLAFLFFAIAKAQVVSTVYPNNSDMAANINVTITGTNVNFSSATGAVLFRNSSQKIHSTGVTVVNNSTIVASFSIPVGGIWIGDYAVDVYALTSHLDSAFTINPTGGGSSYGYVEGLVTRDLDSNCVYGGIDLPLQNKIVEINSNPATYLSTDINGYYGGWVPLGTHTISTDTTLWNKHLCTSGSLSVNVTTTGATYSGNDFSMYETPYTSSKMWLSAATHRPGFTIPIYCNYENNSNSTFDLTYKVLLDSIMTYSSATVTPTSINNDTLIFVIPQVPPYTISRIIVYGVVPPLPTVSLGQNLWHEGWLEANVNPPEYWLGDNYMKIRRGVQGSYDPNDIQLTSPDKDTIDIIALEDTLLTYLVRFQNTGNDTAFNISVKDTLDTLLNASTLQIEGASHNYIFSMSGNGAFEFLFPNVLLPDSNVNEPGSHGYFSYTIERKKGLVLGDVIKNTASIYFDFNPAVVTNTTIHTIDTIPLGLTGSIPEQSIKVYPVPAGNQVFVEWEHKFKGNLNLYILNAQGKMLETRSVSNPLENQKIGMDLESYPAGVYFLIIQDNEGQAVRKFLKY